MLLKYRSNRYAIALIEKTRIDVSLASVSETFVTPGCAPAIANDEALVCRVADNSHSVAAPNRVGLESIQFATGRCGVIPGCIDVQASHDGAMGGKPAAPIAQVLG
jgi:hypothetical protein